MRDAMRVMVVDDSALYRKVISAVLSGHPAIEVVATAPNGKIALDKIPGVNPDLITLDMEMPQMDGLTTLQHLKDKHDQIKTIIFSHHTEKGAELTLKALNLGAVDFVTKPSTSGSLEKNMELIREELLPDILELSKTVKRFGVRQEVKPVNRAPQTTQMPVMAPRDVIAIGISTGGPTSLMNFFSQIPSTLKQTLLIVQHMPAIFTRKLAEQISRESKIPVTEAVDGETILPAHAYIAPGGFHMEVWNDAGVKKIRTHKGPQENYCRPAADVLFRSVAEVYNKKAVGVVMTGMGKDGLKGTEVLRATGAPIVAQDETSSVVWGMPRFVIENNLANLVSPLDKMYESIKKFII